jgi:hypothetical protein
VSDIAAFISARLEEDEAYALEAAKEFGPDWIEIWSGTVDLSANLPLRQRQQVATWDAHVPTNDSRVSRHMVRHDPARVLREVAAKRRVLARHGAERWPQGFPPAAYELPEGYEGPLTAYCDTCSTTNTEGLDNYYEPWPCGTVKDLASVHEDSPDYEQAWRVE